LIARDRSPPRHRSKPQQTTRQPNRKVEVRPAIRRPGPLDVAIHTDFARGSETAGGSGPAGREPNGAGSSVMWLEAGARRRVDVRPGRSRTDRTDTAMTARF